jgi:hypothetical protein
MSRIALSLATLLAFAVAGCNQPAPGAGTAAAPAPQAIAPAPVPPPAPKPAAPKPAPIAKVEPGTRLVANGGFEDWKNDGPDRWQLTAGSLVGKSSPANQGKISLSLKPAKEGYSLVQQQLRAIPAGTKMQVHCLASAPHVGAFALKLSYRVAGKQESVSNIYEKYGAWSSVGFEFVAPANADPKSYVVQLLRSQDVKGDVLVDAVSIITQ